jgi:hypothetical protein
MRRTAYKKQGTSDRRSLTQQKKIGSVHLCLEHGLRVGHLGGSWASSVVRRRGLHSCVSIHRLVTQPQVSHHGWHLYGVMLHRLCSSSSLMTSASAPTLRQGSVSPTVHSRGYVTSRSGWYYLIDFLNCLIWIWVVLVIDSSQLLDCSRHMETFLVGLGEAYLQSMKNRICGSHDSSCPDLSYKELEQTDGSFKPTTVHKVRLQLTPDNWH